MACWKRETRPLARRRLERRFGASFWRERECVSRGCFLFFAHGRGSSSEMGGMQTWWVGKGEGSRERERTWETVALASTRALDFLLLLGALSPGDVCSWSAEVLSMGKGSLVAMVTASIGLRPVAIGGGVRRGGRSELGGRYLCRKICSETEEAITVE